MGESVYRQEYRVLLSLLRAAREQAGLTQYDLAQRLQKSQSFVGKCELGERRLDVVQLRDFCGAIGVDFAEFILQYEAALKHSARESNATRPKAKH